MSGMPQMTPEQMASMPLSPSPKGLPPNFDNPETNGPQAIAVMSLFLGLAAATVFLRLWSRIRIVKRPAWDDAAAVAALIFTASAVGFEIYIINLKAIGRHAWDVRLVTFMQPKVGGAMLGMQLSVHLANLFAKLAILLFIGHLFPRKACPKTAFCVWTGVFFNVVVYFIIVLYTCIMCIPRVGGDGRSPARCTAQFQLKIGVASASVNAALDFYIFATAVPSLWMLQMPMKRKLSVVSILAIGLCACALSLATLVKRATMDISNPDHTWNSIPLVVIGVLEPCVALISASLPTLPALWAKLSTTASASFHRLFSKTSFSGTSMGSGARTDYIKTEEDSSLKSLRTHNVAGHADPEHGHNFSYSVK